MSEKLVSSTCARTARSTDPRARFTRDVLGDALVALLQEWPFDRITVSEIVRRAGVGRTTFYAHYLDKQDLFLSDVEEFFEGMAGLLDRQGAPEERLLPVRELFTHVESSDDLYRALAASGKLAEVRELGVGCLARAAEQRLRRLKDHASESELRAISHALAGALFALLDGSMAGPVHISPEAADALFHRLAWGGLARVAEIASCR